MQSLTTATTPREYRGCVPIDGYVHKFRLEAREEAAAENRPQLDTTPTVRGRWSIGTVTMFREPK